MANVNGDQANLSICRGYDVFCGIHSTPVIWGLRKGPNVPCDYPIDDPNEEFEVTIEESPHVLDYDPKGEQEPS